MPCISHPMQSCLALSLSFTFIFTAYSALFFLQSSLNQDSNLGVASLAVMYICVTVFSTMSPLIIKSLGAKKVTLLAWLAFTLYTTSNFYPAWVTFIPACIVLGMFSGAVWTCSNLYLDKFTEDYASLHGTHSENDRYAILSRFGGIFYLLFHLTDICGNLVSSLILIRGVDTNASQNVDLDLCGTNNCPGSYDSNESLNTTIGFMEPERHVVYIFLVILMGLNVCGLLLTSFAVPYLETAATIEPTKVCGHYISCFRMAINPAMIPLIPIFMVEATARAILADGYAKSFVSCALGVHMVGFVNTAYGVSSAITSYSVSHSFAKYLGRPVLFLTSISLAMTTCIFMLLWQPSRNDSVFVYLVAPLMTGLSSGIINPQLIALVPLIFKEKKSEAFATLTTSKAVAFAFVFTSSFIVCLPVQLVICVFIYVMAGVGYLWTEVKYRKRAALEESEVLTKGEQ